MRKKCAISLVFCPSDALRKGLHTPECAPFRAWPDEQLSRAIRRICFASSPKPGRAGVGRADVAPGGAEAFAAERHRLDDGENGRADAQGKPLDGIAREPRHQRLAAAIEPDLHARPIHRPDLGHHGFDHVQRAHRLGPLQRDHHVARLDLHPHAFCPAPPQAAARARFPPRETSVVRP